jgi:hypothetical protein
MVLYPFKKKIKNKEEGEERNTEKERNRNGVSEPL